MLNLAHQNSNTSGAGEVKQSEPYSFVEYNLDRMSNVVQQVEEEEAKEIVRDSSLRDSNADLIEKS